MVSNLLLAALAAEGRCTRRSKRYRMARAIAMEQQGFLAT